MHSQDLVYEVLRCLMYLRNSRNPQKVASSPSRTVWMNQNDVGKHDWLPPNRRNIPSIVACVCTHIVIGYTYDMATGQNHKTTEMGYIHFLQPDTLSAARETQQGNESTINQRKQEMIWGQRRESQWTDRTHQDLSHPKNQFEQKNEHLGKWLCE